MHPGQLEVTPEVVGGLVADQFPQWRGLAITPVSSDGTVNALFRIGDDLVARFPLVGEDVERTRASLEDEAGAAGELAAASPVPTPLPVAIGSPGRGYPLPWSVQTWLSGTVAAYAHPGASIPFARDLAGFIAGLRALDTRGRSFSGAGRGGSLEAHDEWMETCFRESERLVDVPRLRRLWHELRGLAPSEADVMSHSDLTPGNVLVHDGRLVGVIDVGGFGPADPALDLVGAWHLLDDGPRQELRRQLGCDDSEWGRGMGWALQQAMGAVWYYATSNASMSRMANRTIERLLAAGPISSRDRTRTSYDAVAAGYDRGFADELSHKPFDRATLAALADLAGPGPIADIGCGPGQAARFLAGLRPEVVGLDLAPAMAAVAARHGSGVPFAAGSMLDLPLRTGVLSAAVAMYSIIHLDREQRPAAYRELARVLRPGGMLLVSFHVDDADHPAGASSHFDTWLGQHVDLTFHFLDPEEVTNGLEDAGLVVTHSTIRLPDPTTEVATRRCYLLAERTGTHST